MQDYNISKQTALWVAAQKQLAAFATAYNTAMSEQYGADTDEDFDKVFMPLFQPLQDLMEEKIGRSVVDQLSMLDNKGEVL